MATLTSSLSFKENVFPIDVNADYNTNTEGISTGSYYNKTAHLANDQELINTLGERT
jgi:hypothetical protein